MRLLELKQKYNTHEPSTKEVEEWNGVTCEKETYTYYADLHKGEFGEVLRDYIEHLQIQDRWYWKFRNAEWYEVEYNLRGILNSLGNVTWTG